RTRHPIVAAVSRLIPSAAARCWLMSASTAITEYPSAAARRANSDAMVVLPLPPLPTNATFMFVPFGCFYKEIRAEQKRYCPLLILQNHHFYCKFIAITCYTATMDIEKVLENHK